MYNRLFNTAPYNDSRRVVYADVPMAGQASVTVSELVKRSTPIPIVASGSASVRPVLIAYKGAKMAGAASVTARGAMIGYGAAVMTTMTYVGLVGNYVMRGGGASITGTAVVTVNGKRWRWVVEPSPAASWTAAPGKTLSEWNDVEAPQAKGWRKVGSNG